MKSISTLASAIAVVLLMGGSPAAVAQVAAPASVAAPQAGMSQVVFFRPSGMGMAISCNIRENGKMLGTANNGRYFVLATTPGVHKFTTHGETTDELTIQTEADETAYVKCKIGMGIMSGRPNISPSTKEEFDSRVAKMKPSDPEKMAKAIAADDAHHAGEAAGATH
jgi:hypothetical protein